MTTGTGLLGSALGMVEEALAGPCRLIPLPEGRGVNDDRIRKLTDQILRMRRFVASQEATIQDKVGELAEALGRSIEDTEALLRASAEQE